MPILNFSSEASCHMYFTFWLDFPARRIRSSWNMITIIMLSRKFISFSVSVSSGVWVGGLIFIFRNGNKRVSKQQVERKDVVRTARKYPTLIVINNTEPASEKALWCCLSETDCKQCVYLHFDSNSLLLIRWWENIVIVPTKALTDS